MKNKFLSTSLFTTVLLSISMFIFALCPLKAEPLKWWRMYVYGGRGSMNTPSWSPDSKRLAFTSNSDMSEK